MGFAILSKEKALRVTDDVHARLKKSGAEMKHTSENWTVLGAALKNRNLEMSPDNFMLVISQLTGILEWVKPPKPKPTKFVEQSNHGARVNHADIDAVKATADTLGLKSLRKAYGEEREAQAAKASRQAFADCDRAIRSFTRNTHSKTYAGRERLQKKFDELRRKSTDGVKVLAELQQFEKSIS